MKLSFFLKIKLFFQGYKCLQTKKFFIVYERKTGEPVNWNIPICSNTKELPISFFTNLEINIYKRR